MLRLATASILLLPAVLLACSAGDSQKADADAALRPPQPAATETTAPAKPDGTKLTVTEVAVDELPHNLSLLGHPMAARRWTDRLGDNLLVLTETGGEEDCDQYGCGATVETYGFHYLISGSAQTLLWRTTDKIEKCDVDLTLRVEPESITVTDLDRDGTSETTFVYAMACRGDPSPFTLKLLMHEGATKYALRGHTTAPGGEGEPDGEPAEMTVDPSFNQAPAEFLQFATAQWRKYQRYDTWHRHD
jgi:hypothetical protein